MRNMNLTDDEVVYLYMCRLQGTISKLETSAEEFRRASTSENANDMRQNAQSIVDFIEAWCAKVASELAENRDD